jgi:phthalate 4,5-dioxygenase
VRITEHLMPFVSVVPVGQAQPRSGSVFVISPVDDTHHLLFFGYFGDTPHSAKRPDEICMEGEGYQPDPNDYTRFRGSRDDRWGQDRALMAAGHWTGFGRSLLEEDVVIQTSMGPILDRTKEHLSSSDVAVAHARRMLLDALAAVDVGDLPPGSVRSPDGVRLPNPLEALLRDGERWEDLTLDPAGT